MALMSSEDNNEKNTTKTSTRSKYKYQEKKKQKLKTKLKVSKDVASPVSYETNVFYNIPVTISVPNIIPTMLSSYPIYSNYAYPVLSDWTPGIPVQNPVYTIHLPVVVNPVQIVTTQVYPYMGMIPPAICSPVLVPVNEIVQNNLEPIVYYDVELHNEEKGLDLYTLEYKEIDVDSHKDTIAATDDIICYSNEIDKKIHEADEIVDNETKLNQNNELDDPLEFYLTLPKELFPAARTLTVDPNPIIDEFCKLPNIQKHAPWILDLEFGIPNLPITRPIPSYNVKLNSVNCKNAPDAIHPGFESCDKDFKEVFLFYYDCVISTWYRGYIILSNDRSVENFQSWLLLPAQVLGMCWS